MISFLIFILCISWSNAAPVVDQFAPTVELAVGKVRGLVVETEHGHKVNLYQGIRYGRAKRFSKPTPEKPWSDVYEATKWRSACHQFGFDTRQAWMLNYTESESEDCLFLNVWTPIESQSVKSSTSNLTVMVWIHGGAFETGTIFSELFDGLKYFAEKDVVVVSINYRLGPLGFLYGSSEDAPGNVGLHDQILALNWVKENIAKFGGDPQKVTLFGESAGSMSTGSHILSPLSTGLFHRAIMQSGTPNAITKSPSEALALTKLFASKLHCDKSTTNQEMIKCLRAVPVKDIVTATVGDFSRNEIFIPMYGDSLMPLAPVEAVKLGKFNQNIDLLYGLTKNEGAGFIASFLPPGLNLTEGFMRLVIDQVIALQKSALNSSEIVDFYSRKRSHDDPDNFKLIIGDVFGDYALVCPAILFIETLARHKPNTAHFYSYRLTQHLQYALEIPGQPFPSWVGVPHATDLYYLFARPHLASDPQADKLSKDMIQAWTNFAKNGQPGPIGTVQWEPTLTANPHTQFMDLNVANYSMVAGFFEDTCNAFWGPRLGL